MNALAWVLRLAVVLVLVWFAVRNSQPVTLNGLPGQAWEAPLVFALLVAFLSGVVIGVLAWLPTVFRQRRELGRLRRAAPVSGTVSGATPDIAHGPIEAEPGRKGTAHGV